MNNVRIILSENFPFVVVKFSIYLNRRVLTSTYPQTMFLSRNKKNNGYFCKPQLNNIKVEFKGVKLYSHVFVMSLRGFQCGCVVVISRSCLML